MVRSQSKSYSEFKEKILIQEVCANGISMKTTEVEENLDKGNIQEAESCLRKGLSLSSEDARAILGRLEYQRGNVEGALRVFDGVDFQSTISRLQASLSDKQPSKKGRTHSDSQQFTNLILETIYIKAKSFQKLGRINDAADECNYVLDVVERIFHHGISDIQLDNRLQETVSQSLELLPELWKEAGCYDKAISAYRRALLSQWNLDDECCGRIQKGFAIFLLYSGIQADTINLSTQIDSLYIPKHNLEEAILLLMILNRKYCLGKTKWDPSVIEHLTFALSLYSQTSILAKQYEEIMPGVFHRVDRWNMLALCYSGIGKNAIAINLLRKALHKYERPSELTTLLLAAKICSNETYLAAEGVEYAKRAINNSQGIDEHLKGVAFHMLGVCLGKQAKISSSNFERSHLQSEALKSLDCAITTEPNNIDLVFDLGVQYAEQRNLNAALQFIKQFIDATGGSILKGWRLLALVLSAQQRFSEAEVVIDAALDETTKWEQGPLLKLKAKLKISQSLPMDAIETYRYLLALVQAQRKPLGPFRSISQVEDEEFNEFEVWHGLANIYARLSHWKDVEVCLEKAKELKQFSTELLYTEGVMCEGCGKVKEAMQNYVNALVLHPSYVPCKICIGALVSKMSVKTLPIARSILSDALRIEPTNCLAWYYLGMVYKEDGRMVDATDCFLAASMLEESNPIETFNSMY